MLIESGTVIAREKNHLWVEAQANSACKSCGDSGCGASMMAQLFTDKTCTYQYTDTGQLAVGDDVHLQISDGLLVRAALWGYLIPLLFMAGFAIVAEHVFTQPLLQVVSACSGLATGFGIVRVVTNNAKFRAIYLPDLRGADVSARENFTENDTH